MTPAKARLLDDARRAGYTVTTSGTTTRIARTVGRWRSLEGVELFDDGWAHQLGVDLEAAKIVRSHTRIRGLLGL